MYLRGMSDWNLADLEDIDWDVFGRSDDHIVPHRDVELLDESCSAPSDTNKNPQDEVKNDFGKNMCSKVLATETVLWKEENRYYLPPKDGNSSRLEGTQSFTSNIVVPTFCHLERTANGAALPYRDGNTMDYCASESNTDANSNMFCANDRKSYLSAYNGVSHDVTDFPLLESQQKDSDKDLAYYDWPDISNFDDIDKTLRNWDSAFGQGQPGSADELSWFSSSSNAIYATGYQDTLAFSNYADGSSTGAPPKAKSSSEEKIKTQQSAKDKGIKRSTDQMLLDSDISDPKMYPSQQFSQQKHFKGSPSSYSHNLDPHSQMDFGLPTHHVPFTQMTSNVMFEKETNPSSCFQGSAQCLERFPDQLYMTSVITSDENIESLYQSQQLSCTSTAEHPHQLRKFRSKATSVQKKLPKETRDDNEMECVILELPMLGRDHPTEQESSAMTSVSSPDSSDKVTSFRQLQDVMRQLDVKTKLCIRDSLYRLARSASQRNDFAVQHYSEGDAAKRGIQVADASKRSAELIDPETNTNPIDRSIAHLLFHKPSELITRPTDDTMSLESLIMNGKFHDPVTNQFAPDQLDH